MDEWKSAASLHGGKIASDPELLAAAEVAGSRTIARSLSRTSSLSAIWAGISLLQDDPDGMAVHELCWEIVWECNAVTLGAIAGATPVWSILQNCRDSNLDLFVDSMLRVIRRADTMGSGLSTLLSFVAEESMAERMQVALSKKLSLASPETHSSAAFEAECILFDFAVLSTRPSHVPLSEETVKRLDQFGKLGGVPYWLYAVHSSTRDESAVAEVNRALSLHRPATDPLAGIFDLLYLPRLRSRLELMSSEPK
jgi:hypothetical protein